MLLKKKALQSLILMISMIKIQNERSFFQSVSSILQNAPGLIFALFAGALSDTYGRKPLIILPLLGFFLLNLVYLVNSIWFNELKVRTRLVSHWENSVLEELCYCQTVLQLVNPNQL